jgi:hypothetical protein
MFMNACGSTPQNLLLGKWEVEGAPMKMTAEFERDGTARLTMFGQTLRGTYKVDADQLEWTVNGITTKQKFSVRASELEITNDANQTVKYRRSGN